MVSGQSERPRVRVGCEISHDSDVYYFGSRVLPDEETREGKGDSLEEEMGQRCAASHNAASKLGRGSLGADVALVELGRGVAR